MTGNDEAIGIQLGTISNTRLYNIYRIEVEVMGNVVVVTPLSGWTTTRTIWLNHFTMTKTSQKIDSDTILKTKKMHKRDFTFVIVLTSVTRMCGGAPM